MCSEQRLRFGLFSQKLSVAEHVQKRVSASAHMSPDFTDATFTVADFTGTAVTGTALSHHSYSYSPSYSYYHSALYSLL